MEQTEFSEKSAYQIQTPGNYPEENIQHTEHGESLKLRIFNIHGSHSSCSRHIIRRQTGTGVENERRAECNLAF
jgi:hypothetical protein